MDNSAFRARLLESNAHLATFRRDPELHQQVVELGTQMNEDTDNVGTTRAVVGESFADPLLAFNVASRRFGTRLFELGTKRR
jgi:hypothetical protein